MQIVQPLRNISFEFFPLKDDVDIQPFIETISALNQFNPKFYSVTHGAFESSTERSDQLIDLAQSNSTAPVAAHVTTCNLDRAELMRWIDTLYAKGIRHVVALRGDNKSKMTAKHFQNAAELVQTLREKYPAIKISVAGYPEMHREAKSKKQDLEYMKLKLDAGADNLITQFFFDVDKLAEFKDGLTQIGVDKPIVAGILPVTNYTRMLKMADYCKVSVPKEMQTAYQAVLEDSQSQHKLAIDFAQKLVKDSFAIGIHDFHFYCMNRAKTVSAIINGL